MQPCERIARVGPFRIAAAESAVDFPRRVHQKRGPGQIVIEFKQIQIGAGDADQTNADELVREIVDFFQTDNLQVKLLAVPSRIAAKNHHHGLAGLESLSAGPPGNR